MVGEGTDTWITFVSSANNLIATDVNSREDVFYLNWPSGSIMRASVNNNGIGSNGDSIWFTLMSENSEKIVFSSDADNLTAEGNPDGYNQVFLHDRINSTTQMVTINRFGQPISNPVDFRDSYDISDSGRYVSFSTKDDDVVNNDSNGLKDMFLYDHQTNLTQMVTDLSAYNSVNRGFFNLSHDLVEDLSVDPPLLSLVYNSSMAEFGSNNPNRSLFLYQDYGPGVSLNMTILGQGSVTGSLAYSCDDQCTDTYDIGTDLFLVANAAPGYDFVGWSGDACTDAAQSCQLSVDSDLNIQAVFVDPTDIIFKNGFE